MAERNTSGSPEMVFALGIVLMLITLIVLFFEKVSRMFKWSSWHTVALKVCDAGQPISKLIDKLNHPESIDG